MMEYWALTYNGGKRILYAYSSEDKTGVEIVLGDDRVESVQNYQVKSRKELVRPGYKKIHKISWHIFEIALFAWKRHQRIPFSPRDMYNFSRSILARRYPGVKYEKYDTGIFNKWSFL